MSTGRPIDIPPCTCPATDCPPIKETDMTALPTPQQLIDALTANNWIVHNEGDDAFGPRGWTVRYPLRVDPMLRITVAPHDTAHALTELARAAYNGRHAAAVLASLGGPTCICPTARYDANGGVEPLPQGTDPACGYCHPAQP